MTTGFDSYIAKAREKGRKDAVKRLSAERAICSALVRECLKQGYTVSIHNGEELAVSRATKAKDVLPLMFATDMERLIIARENTALGNFYLVYGNDGYDVISDYSANEACQAIVEAVDATVSRWEQKICG